MVNTTEAYFFLRYMYVFSVSLRETFFDVYFIAKKLT